MTAFADSRFARQLAQGRVEVTVKSAKTGKHMTFKFQTKAVSPGGKWTFEPFEKATFLFVTEGYDRVARFRLKDGEIQPGSSAWQYLTDDPARLWAIERLFNFLFTGEGHPQLEIVTSDRCGCCFRKLTDPESIKRGVGPECYGKVTGSKYVPHAQPAQQQIV